MVRTLTRLDLPVGKLIDQVFTLGHLTRQEYLLLTSVILSNYKVTEEERVQINRIFDHLQIGRLRLSD